MDTQTAQGERVLRWPETCRRAGYCRTKLWQMVKDGDFPAPVALGARSVGFLESEVTAWLRSRPRASWASTIDPGAGK